MDSSYLVKCAESAGMDDALPATLAALRLGVTVATVKGWAARDYVDPETGERKRLEPVDTDPHWGRLYRVRDLVAWEERTSRSPNRRSRTRARDHAEAAA